MIYRIYKTTGRIGTDMEKVSGPMNELSKVAGNTENRIPLAAFDNEANTIHIFNDEIIDISSIVQKFKNHCDLPNNHQFNILPK